MTRFIVLSLVLACATLSHATPAGSQVPLEKTLSQPEEIPTADPIIAIDDTRTHGPTARNWFDVWFDGAWLQSPHFADTFALAAQFTAGAPSFQQQNARELLSPYDVYQFRIRYNAFQYKSDWLFGPMTFAVQRYFSIAPLAIKPLVFAHFGVEFAVSSPWFSDRFETPPPGIRVLDATDTELVDSGWSVRPLSGYFRADFLACRSAYAELGGSPELFAPSSGGMEYNVRLHVAGGWSFGCANKISRYHPKLTVEYRDRFRLSSTTQPLDYEQVAGIGLQSDVFGFAAQAYFTVNPVHMSYQTYGIRLQWGAKRSTP
jgi:hypothetical protein